MEMLNQEILLHVGLTKTGTKTIQMSLFADHSQIYYLGKVVHNQLPRRCRSELVYDILKFILWELDQPLDTESVRKLYHRQLLPRVQPGKLLVGSWECLGNIVPHLFQEMLTRLQAVFDRCRVMVVLRNPFNQIPSEYLQQIQGHFIRKNSPWIGSKPFVDIEEWFERWVDAYGGVRNVFCYSQNIQTSIDRLGRENVGVFLFEQLLENPELYYRNVCGFMGIDAEEGIQLSSKKHLHKRISQQQMDFLRALNSSWWQRLKLNRKSKKERQRIWNRIAVDCGDAVEPARVNLPTQLEQKIVVASQSGHRWLVENLNLPLQHYGYPL